MFDPIRASGRTSFLGGKMSTKIFWFSGSGNSLYMAKRIAQALGDAELVPIAGSVGRIEELPRRFGIVFPVYAWGPPGIVADFMQNLPDGETEYVFAVATCGGSPGSAMAIAKKMLLGRGITLDAAMTVRMVENYPPMGGAPDSVKQEAILTDAGSEIDGIVASIKDGFHGVSGKNNAFFSLLGRVVYPLFRKNVSRQADKFLSDGKCTSCGVCVKICPVGNISLDEEGRPVWGDRCEQCFACFHWCPEKSVQFGKKTEDQVRYHHPGISLGEMMPRSGSPEA
jgi:ferredoxin